MDKHAPQKEKWIRGNTKRNVNKNLGSVVMNRSKLKNKTNKSKSHNSINYKSQSSLGFKLNKKSKIEYFDKYNPNKQSNS